jgi:hypothetical protein
MGILTDQNAIIVPPASMAANSLIGEARDVWNRMVGSFNESAKFFWSHPGGLTPQEIADALGETAVEVFTLHGKLGQLIAGVDESAVSPSVGLVGEFTYNEDGTVTIVSVPTPVSPEPQIEPPLVE